MSEKKKFLLRLDGDVFGAMEKWAADELRSVNAQIEFLLRGMLKQEGRLKDAGSPPRSGNIIHKQRKRT